MRKEFFELTRALSGEALIEIAGALLSELEGTGFRGRVMGTDDEVRTAAQMEEAARRLSEAAGRFSGAGDRRGPGSGRQAGECASLFHPGFRLPGRRRIFGRTRGPRGAGAGFGTGFRLDSPGQPEM